MPSTKRIYEYEVRSKNLNLFIVAHSLKEAVEEFMSVYNEDPFTVIRVPKILFIVNSRHQVLAKDIYDARIKFESDNPDIRVERIRQVV